MVSGYKQTDIGLIPVGWNVKIITDLSNPVRGGSPRPAGDPKYFNGTYIPWLTVASLTNLPKSKLFVNKIDSYLTKEGSLRSRILEKDTLIIANSGATLGIVKILSIKCCANDGVAALLNLNKSINKLFLAYYMNTRTDYLRDVVATGNGQPNLNTTLIGNLQIPLPPLPEQEAIAEVLSDTDALIGALEKRIAKKRLIKQGAMQTLLTPKDDWEVKKLGEVGGTYGGLSGKSKKDFEDGNYPYIPFMNIMSNPIIDKNYVDFVNIKKGEIHNKALKGDLFFNGSSETPEEVGMCSILMNDIPNLYLNSFCFGFRFYKTTNENGLFFVYYFRSNEGRKHFRLLAQGATRYNLSKTQLLKMEIPFPPIQEQNRIATILSDMDNEIDALEKKLSKTKELKQGLMQQLLTGKIRLV